MPYTQRSPQPLSRHIVTMRRLEETNWQVADEMERLGLWTEALDEVVVRLVPASLAAYGWHSGTPGSISIPTVSLAQLRDYFTGHYMHLADIIRHEFAHAVAGVHPGFVRCPRFVRCFGGAYDYTGNVAIHDPAKHITPYASTMPAEDFAEVFHYYIRHKGRLPIRLRNKPVIAKKWRFIARMAQRLTAGHQGF